jgi:hypothetical protein
MVPMQYDGRLERHRIGNMGDRGWRRLVSVATAAVVGVRARPLLME